MKLRFRRLRLRVETDQGGYGADLRFKDGLNVIWADNTKGKSTILQSLVYALGLERMLSPKRTIPLAYVMTSHLTDEARGIKPRVLESSVWLEIENEVGNVITVRRPVIGAADRRLVSVWTGGVLAEGFVDAEQRDYFVHDPGAAQREAGFHRMLSSFIGWELPEVRRLDGTETVLYLETLFPLFFVEQKAGWSTIPAAFPTWLQIRDTSRRAVEFVMGLESGPIELRRQRVDTALAQLKGEWASKVGAIVQTVQGIGGRVTGLPTLPTASPTAMEAVALQVREGDVWLPLSEVRREIAARVEALRTAEGMTVTSAGGEASTRITELSQRLGRINFERMRLFQLRQTEIAAASSLMSRIAALDEDLEKNLDAQKLRRLGSALGVIVATDHCPTCAQPIADSLLPQEPGIETMGVAENIEYIRAQREIFARLQRQSESTLNDIDARIEASDAELRDAAALLRASKDDLQAPSSAPSTAQIAERLRLEQRFESLAMLEERISLWLADFEPLVERYASLAGEKAELANSRHSERDQAKVAKFAELVRAQARDYGFSTFDASEIDISADTFRPQKEGFELGFELSASDAIRLKWAYELGLMELARSFDTNHPRLLVFDEPRQQEARQLSFQELLKRAAQSGRHAEQVIFATSEDRSTLESYVRFLDCNLIPYDGYIIQAE